MKAIQELIKRYQLASLLVLTLLLAVVLPLSLVLFGLLMEYAGFVPALFTLIVGSALAGKEFKIGEVLLLATGLTAFSVVLFIWGLGLPYPLLVGLQ